MSDDTRGEGEASFAWITGHMRQFLPDDEGDRRRSRIKPLTEWAMVYAYLNQWWAAEDWPSLGHHLRRWRAALVDAGTGGWLARQVRADPDNGLYLIQPYGWLRAAGHRSDAMEELVRELWLAGSRPTSWGVVHCLRKAGYIRQEPDWPRLCRRHILASQYSEETLRRDAYRVTHAVYYLTDFGNHCAPLREHEIASLAGLTRRIAQAALRNGEWDLLGEAFIALRCLRTPVIAEREWSGRVSLERLQNGGVPHHAGASGSFSKCYHATLVDALYRAQQQLGVAGWGEKAGA